MKFWQLKMDYIAFIIAIFITVILWLVEHSRSSKPLVVVIDGIIGAGKSTIIQELAKSYPVIKEPVSGWIDSGLLSKFYEDKSRWGYLFQANAFYDRVQAFKAMFSNSKSQIFISERSMSSDQIFMDLLHEDKYVTDLEYSIYQKWCSLWPQLLPSFDIMYVYLDTNEDISSERIHKRGRPGENVPQDYLHRLKEKHDQFFLHTRHVRIDGSKDVMSNVQEIQSHIKTHVASNFMDG